MSLVAKYTQGLKGLKLKELVPYSRKYAQENLQPEQLRSTASQRMLGPTCCHACELVS